MGWQTLLVAALAVLALLLNHLAQKEYALELGRLRQQLAAMEAERQPKWVAEGFRRNEDSEHLHAFVQEMEASTHPSLSKDDEGPTVVTMASTTETTTTTAAMTMMNNKDKKSQEKRERMQPMPARKRSIRDDSSHRSRQFHLTFNQKLSDMEHNINEYIQQEVKFCLGFKKSLGDYMHQRSMEINVISEQVASLVESQTQILHDAEKRLTSQASLSHQWLQQLIVLTRAASDSEVNSLHNFFSEAFMPVAQALRQVLLQHRSELASLSRQLNAQLQQHLEAVQGFAAAQSDSLARLRDSLLHTLLEQQQQLERARDLGRGAARAHRAFSKELAFQLEQASHHLRAAHDMWESHHHESNETMTQSEAGVAAAYDSSDKLLHLATSGLDAHIKRTADMSAAYEALSEDTLESTALFVEKATGSLASAERLRDDLEVGVRSAIAATEATWREHYQRTEQDLRKLSESLRTEQQSHQDSRQMLVNSLKEAAEMHEALLEQQRINFGGYVRQRQDDLDRQCILAADWAHHLAQELHQCDMDLEDYLKAERHRFRVLGPQYSRHYLQGRRRNPTENRRQQRHWSLSPMADLPPSQEEKESHDVRITSKLQLTTNKET